MKFYELEQEARRRRLNPHYIKELEQWQWDLHVTHTYGTQYPTFGPMIKRSKAWLRNFKEQHPGIKFAGRLFPIRPKDEANHVHILLASDPTSLLRPRNIPSHELRNLEELLEGADASCRITTAYERTNHVMCQYIYRRKNADLNKPDRWDMSLYRPNLLLQLQNKKADNDFLRCGLCQHLDRDSYCEVHDKYLGNLPTGNCWHYEHVKCGQTKRCPDYQQGR